MTLEEYREQYRKDLRHEVDKLSNEYEAQLKAKDEKIDRLKLQLLNAHNDTGIPTYRVEK